MFSEKNRISEEELVLIESQSLQEKCGKCGEQLILESFYSNKGYQQRITCKKCGLSFWKTIQKKER